MKTMLFFVYLVLISFFAYSQMENLKYIQIKSYANIQEIEISNIEDFIDIVKDNKIKVALIIDSGIKGDYSKVFIKVSDLYYSYQLKGYKSLQDYIDGLNSGFDIGIDYYEAEKIGINNYDTYIFYKRNNFINVEDCKKAYANGFAQTKQVNQLQILPLKITKEKVALRRITWIV